MSILASCKHYNKPKSISVSSCCPSIPPQMVSDASCDCSEDSPSEALCILQCTLDQYGWLNENMTVDKGMASESILNRTRNAKAWKHVIPSLVEFCIDDGRHFHIHFFYLCIN